MKCLTLLVLIPTLSPVVTEARVPQETHLSPTEANSLSRLTWGDSSLRLALEGDILVARENDGSSTVMSWSPSASFLACARTGRAGEK